SQAHPQLGGPRIPFPWGGAALIRELQALVRERMQLHVRPRRQAVPVAKTQWLAGPLRFHRERAERVSHFALLHAASERDGTQVVTMQPAGELSQHRMLGVGGPTLDHELIARHAKGPSRAIF